MYRNSNTARKIEHVKKSGKVIKLKNLRVKKYKDTITDIIKNYEPTIENTRKYIDYKYKKLSWNSGSKQ